MSVQILKVIAKVAMPVLFVTFAVAGFAEDVTFTTVGDIGCGTAVDCTQVSASEVTVANAQGNVLTITAIGLTGTDVQAGNPNIDDVNIAQFDDSLSKNNNFGKVSTAGLTFSLDVTQSAPTATPNTGSFAGTFSGLIGTSVSTAQINFTNTTVLIGNVTYTLDNTPWTIKSPGFPGVGVTTDTATVTPEPTFMMLTGLGFAGVAFVAYRRRRAV
jgi:hypothetical protein